MPIRDGSDIIGIAGINIDITEARQTEMLLNEREAQYRSLIENSRDMIYMVYEDRFVLVNQRFTDVTGVTPEEMYAGKFTTAQLADIAAFIAAPF